MAKTTPIPFVIALLCVVLLAACGDTRAAPATVQPVASTVLAPTVAAAIVPATENTAGDTPAPTEATLPDTPAPAAPTAVPVADPNGGAASALPDTVKKIMAAQHAATSWKMTMTSRNGTASSVFVAPDTMASTTNIDGKTIRSIITATASYISRDDGKTWQTLPGTGMNLGDAGAQADIAKYTAGLTYTTMPDTTLDGQNVSVIVLDYRAATDLAIATLGLMVTLAYDPHSFLPVQETTKSTKTTGPSTDSSFTLRFSDYNSAANIVDIPTTNVTAMPGPPATP